MGRVGRELIAGMLCVRRARRIGSKVRRPRKRWKRCIIELWLTVFDGRSKNIGTTK